MMNYSMFCWRIVRLDYNVPACYENDISYMWELLPVDCLYATRSAREGGCRRISRKCMHGCSHLDSYGEIRETFLKREHSHESWFSHDCNFKLYSW